ILILSVALGLAIFVALAMVRTIYSIPIHYLLIGGYIAVFALSMFVPDAFVSISFDAGGVTTGPMAVPFILALGVGVASVLRTNSSSASEGFGLIGLASIGPVLAIMILGVLFQWTFMCLMDFHKSSKKLALRLSPYLSSLLSSRFSCLNCLNNGY